MHDAGPDIYCKHNGFTLPISVQLSSVMILLMNLRYMNARLVETRVGTFHECTIYKSIRTVVVRRFTSTRSSPVVVVVGDRREPIAIYSTHNTTANYRLECKKSIHANIWVISTDVLHSQYNTRLFYRTVSSSVDAALMSNNNLLVYLLTPMNRATLPHTQSITSHCIQCIGDVECIHQATAFVDIDSTLVHRPTAAGF